MKILFWQRVYDPENFITNSTPISYLKWMPYVFDNERLNKLLKLNWKTSVYHFNINIVLLHPVFLISLDLKCQVRYTIYVPAFIYMLHITVKLLDNFNL